MRSNHARVLSFEDQGQFPSIACSQSDFLGYVLEYPRVEPSYSAQIQDGTGQEPALFTINVPTVVISDHVCHIHKLRQIRERLHNTATIQIEAAYTVSRLLKGVRRS